MTEPDTGFVGSATTRICSTTNVSAALLHTVIFTGVALPLGWYWDSRWRSCSSNGYLAGRFSSRAARAAGGGFTIVSRATWSLMFVSFAHHQVIG
jgi:hypothetical protein